MMPGGLPSPTTAAVLTAAPPPCHHRMAAEEVGKAQQLMTQLLSVLFDPPTPTLPAQAGMGVAGGLLEQAVQSSVRALAMLRSCCCTHPPEASNSGGRAGQKRVNPCAESGDVQKRRKKQQYSFITVTSTPHFDGYRWKKYGQKLISKSKFPRSYYRCVHFRDQGCQATKTVQMKEEEDANVLEFVVAYKMNHSCKFTEVISAIPLVESANNLKISSESEIQQNYDSRAASSSSSDHLQMDSGSWDLWDLMPDLNPLINLWDIDGFEWLM